MSVFTNNIQGCRVKRTSILSLKFPPGGIPYTPSSSHPPHHPPKKDSTSFSKIIKIFEVKI